ncbi:MAG: hypothetical protein HYT79_07090 [Elusimicrobia bacterium]|nr:hypothetical protein [Elusimicrobiota bacterium]
MKYLIEVAQDSKGRLYLKRATTAGKPAYKRICTSQDASRKLQRSRRQIYRLLETQVIKTHGKFLGEWLLDLEGVEKLAGLPKSLKKPPKKFQVLFPEYPINQINPYRDVRLMLSRILDQGTRQEMKWVLRRYPISAIRDFLKQDGSRVLSAKSLRLWSLCFDVKPSLPPKWRLSGRAWGGA